MFKSFLRTIAVATALAGGIASTAAPVAAEGVRVGVAIGHPTVTPARYVRHHRRARPVACTAGHALRKAGRLGVHRAHVRRLDRRVIVVAGRSHRSRAVVRFARTRGCPVISYRRR